MEDETPRRGQVVLMALLSQIAAWSGAVLDPCRKDVEILRVSGIADASADAIVFATNSTLLGAALASPAGAILASQSLREASEDARVLFVDDPRYAFAEIAGHLRPDPCGPAIHPQACIEPGVSLGPGTRVGPGAVISSGVRVGAQCDILANVTIYAGTTLGNRVVVQSGAILGATGFGYVRHATSGRYLAFPQQGTLVVEDDVEIGANTTIDRGALGETRIGYGTKIDNLVHIAHNCVIGANVIIAAQTGISGSTVIGAGAVIGGQVGIGDHATIGEGVVLGSGSGVLSQKKVRGPGQVFWGTPAQPLRQYLRDLARLRRGGTTAE